MEISIVDWRQDLECFDVVKLGQSIRYFDGATDAIRYAAEQSDKIIVENSINPQRLVELSAAAIFAGVTLYRRDGSVASDPMPAPLPIRYITRAELGSLLPDGWFIEVQNGRYAACFGEENQMPFRATIVDAVRDIRVFLATAINASSRDLAESLRAAPVSEEWQQHSF